MRLTVIIKFLPLILFPLLSCDKNTELFPWQCNCNIDVMKLSKSGAVTYHVFTNGDATVSSVTYQTSDGQVTVDNPSLPFKATTKMGVGETVLLTAKGNPGKGNIVLTYDVENSNDERSMLSSSASRVWVLKNGNCK